MKILNLICLLLIVFLQSCFQSNSIYFNVELQEIKSCNNKGIKRIYIASDSTNENYRIEWKNDNQTPPTVIKLIPLTTGYIITSSWKNIQITPSKFKLNSNRKYTIERTQGDATPYKIEVFTNEEGNIYKTNKNQCNN